MSDCVVDNNIGEIQILYIILKSITIHLHILKPYIVLVFKIKKNKKIKLWQMYKKTYLKEITHYITKVCYHNKHFIYLLQSTGVSHHSICFKSNWNGSMYCTNTTQNSDNYCLTVFVASFASHQIQYLLAKLNLKFFFITKCKLTTK